MIANIIVDRTGLQRMQGSHRCTYSQKQMRWLRQVSCEQEITIQHALSPEGEFIIKGVGRVDGYCIATNTVYEFHGDYWHGNPLLYDPDDFNPQAESTFRALFLRTVKRDRKIRRLGYNLVVRWETPINEEDYYPKLRLSFWDCSVHGVNYLASLYSVTEVFPTRSEAEEALRLRLHKCVWLYSPSAYKGRLSVIVKQFSSEALEVLSWYEFEKRYRDLRFKYQEGVEYRELSVCDYLFTHDEYYIEDLMYSEKRQCLRRRTLYLGTKSNVSLGPVLALYFLLFEAEGKDAYQEFSQWCYQQGIELDNVQESLRAAWRCLL